MKQSPESHVTTGVLPVHPRDWLAWVAACAIAPVFYAVATTLLWRESHATIWLSLAIIVVCLTLPGVFQWRALRLIAPTLRLWVWMPALLLFGVLLVQMKAWALSFWPEVQAIRAVHEWHRFGSGLGGLLGLPWIKVGFLSALLAIVPCLFPAWAVAHATRRSIGVVLAAVVIGAAFAGVVELAFKAFHTDLVASFGYGLNGMSWPSRFKHMIFFCGVSAAWGAGSATAAAWLWSPAGEGSERRTKWVMVVGCLWVAVVGPATGYLVHPAQVWSQAANAVGKALSRAPAADLLEGQEILRHVGDAGFAAPKYPVVHFSPDSGSFVALDNERVVRRLSVPEGRELGALGEKLGPDEKYSVAWSPDGRYLALRTDAEEVAIPNTRYTRHRSRVRLYALPEAKMVGEYVYRDDECFGGGFSEEVIFEGDGQSLWLRCHTFYTSPRTPAFVVAVRMAVPSMTLLQVHRYGDTANDGEVEAWSRVNGEVRYWQRGTDDSRVVVRALRSGNTMAVLEGLSANDRGGHLTYQHTRFEGDRFVVEFCGRAGDVSNPVPGSVDREDAHRVHSYCRQLFYGGDHGEFLGLRDTGPGWRLALDLGGGLEGEATVDEDNKAGVVVVRGTVDGGRRQKLTSVAQRPLRVSPDGRWLIMHGRDQGKLRVYAVAGNTNPPTKEQ